MAGSGTEHLVGAEAVLRAANVSVRYRSGRGRAYEAVGNLSLDVRKGETLGLVGESGCGKSTTARALLRLEGGDEGSVVFDDVEITALPERALRRVRPMIQLIFQDPTGSLNPRRRVRDIVAEGLSISKAPTPWDHRVDAALRAVGLDPAVVGARRPAELSGGQCQRVAIARAIVLEPAVLVCDEAVSSLDVSIQAQILNLLESLKAEYHLTIVFIAHNLAVVKNVSDRVIVMYRGKICEVGATDVVYSDPGHPYTRALLSAVPNPDPRMPLEPAVVSGEPETDPFGPGCRFRSRCSNATAICAAEEPVIRRIGDEHFLACHHPMAGNRSEC